MRLTRREFLAGLGLARLGGASLPLLVNETGEAAETPRRGGVLRYGLGSPPTTVDPHAGPGGGSYIITYERLVMLNDDWTGFDPALASRWERSVDGRNSMFYLSARVPTPPSSH